MTNLDFKMSQEQANELKDRANVISEILGVEAYGKCLERGFILISKKRYKELILKANAKFPKSSNHKAHHQDKSAHPNNQSP